MKYVLKVIKRINDVVFEVSDEFIVNKILVYM